MEMFEVLTHKQKLFQRIVGSILIIGAALCILQPEYHALRVFTRHAPQITLGYWLMGLAFLALKNARLTMLSFICCGFLCLVFKGTPSGKIEQPLQVMSQTISVAQINVAMSNSNHAETIDAIKKTGVDVLSLQEVDLEWSHRLKDSLSSLYPYSCRVERVDIYGIELFSKYPFATCDTFYSEDIPNLIISLKKTPSSIPIYIVSTFIAPPIYSAAYETMKKQMHIIAEHVKSITQPLITVGDYNIEPSSIEVQQFKQELGLLGSRKGFSPSRKDGYFDFTEVPTDYILFTPHLECTYFETIVGKKNEHLGILGNYQLSNSFANAQK